MFIFLFLIFVLVALIGVFIYLNKKDYYEIKPPQIIQNNGTSGQIFTPSATYYTVLGGWKELSTSSQEVGEVCYTNVTCKSGYCRSNPDTGQTKCTATSSGENGFTEISIYENAPSLSNYGTEYLYTAICAQQSGTIETISYYPSYQNQTLIDENLTGITFENTCTNYTFQQTPLSSSITCYDADQLAGTKIVELCQAAIGTNQVCINNNGDRVYSPSLNSLYIKPELTLCEDNTSIEYITFNFNNMPQTIQVLENSKEDGVDLYNNQMMCLSIDNVTYYPNISVTKITSSSSYYVTFIGSWGFNYIYKIDGSSTSDFTIDQTATVQWYDPVGNSTSNNITLEMSSRIVIDFSYGITYIIPRINFGSSSFTLSNQRDATKSYSYGDIIDVIQDTKYTITSGISLKPCSIFNTSYTQYTNLKSLSGNVDKQRFKISRYSMTEDVMTANENGIISSIIYRNLNYENGGLYLDYYSGDTTDDDSPSYLDLTGDQIVLRKVNSLYPEGSRVWLLMPPMQLSPFTIPSGKNMWCNYATDVSINGGNTFNGQKTAFVPMESIPISIGTEIIDPTYNAVAKQPDNILFNVIGNEIEGAAALGVGISLSASGPIGEGLAGLEIYELTKVKNSSFNFHLLKNDPSFAKCSQICSNIITDIPRVKAVAITSGTLGSVPPGHSRGVTQSFSEGNIIAGINLGGQTCATYYLYNTDSNIDLISSRKIGSTYYDGDVEFLVKGTYDGTYLFDKDYFNTDSDIVISSVTSQGSGYGTVPLPYNVINSLSPVSSSTQTVQFLPYNTTSASAPSPDTVGCTTSTYNDTAICDLSKMTNADFCTNVPLQGSGVFINNAPYYGFIQKMNNITGWVIKVGGKSSIPIKLVFKTNTCDGSSSGLQNYYYVSTARLDFDISSESSPGFVGVASETIFDQLFPSNIDSATTSYEVYDSDDNQLYDINGNPLTLEVAYSNFQRVYRIYYGSTYVARAIIVSNAPIANSSNTKNPVNPAGNISNGMLQIVEIINGPTITSNITETFTLQEWWTMEVSYDSFNMTIEYQNTNASGCTLNLTFDTSEWDILQPAPRNLYSPSGSELIMTSYTLSLLNSNILKPGPSPQQIVYAGSFQKNNKYCYDTYPEEFVSNLQPDQSLSEVETTDKTNQDNCNNDPRCSFNGKLGRCVGKSLLDYGNETLSNPFTTSGNFSPEIFNNLKETPESIFTDFTFLKSLQIDTLNYMGYTPMPSQTPEGASPEYYLTPPDFITYSNQNVTNTEVANASVKLGKFIPYQYFYPNFNREGKEYSTLTTQMKVNKQNENVDNFYVNLNYTQFIPYGKKSLYENGFTKITDIPTF